MLFEIKKEIKKKLCLKLIEPELDKTSKMTCVPNKDWSTSGASTQSDQSFRCPPEDGLGTKLPIKCMPKILIIGLDKMLR